MVVNCLFNSFFVYKNKDLIIFKSEEELNNFIVGYDKYIITNNSYSINYDKIIDIRVFNWLMNNYCDYNYLCWIKDVNRKNVVDLSEQQLNHVKKNYNYFVDKCVEYTKYYKSINKLFKFDYNKSYYYNLKEKYLLDYDIKKNIKDIKMEQFQEIDEDVKYSFLTNNCKIYSSSKFLTKIDRKNNMSLFKLSNDKKYYLIDFSGFEVRSLYFYINNKRYIHEKFYDICADFFKIERKDFKLKFLMWLNGAGTKALEDYYEKFNKVFKDVLYLKKQINNNKVVNYFGHCMLYNESYKRLGLLITSTAYDFLVRFYDKCKDLKNIKFIWNLFDEFLIECDKDYDINNFMKSKYFPYKVVEV